MRKAIFGTVLLATTTYSFAAPSDHFVGGIGFAQLNDDVLVNEVSLNAVFGSLGYEYKVTNTFTLIPELRVGLGVGDDTVTYNNVSVDVELDEFIAFSVKGQLDLSEQFYLFANPSYGRVGLSASHSNGSASDSSAEFGVGFGAGLQISNSTALELSYEDFNGTDAIGLSLKFDL